MFCGSLDTLACASQLDVFFYISWAAKLVTFFYCYFFRVLNYCLYYFDFCSVPLPVKLSPLLLLVLLLSWLMQLLLFVVSLFCVIFLVNHPCHSYGGNCFMSQHHLLLGTHKRNILTPENVFNTKCRRRVVVVVVAAMVYGIERILCCVESVSELLYIIVNVLVCWMCLWLNLSHNLSSQILHNNLFN